MLAPPRCGLRSRRRWSARWPGKEGHAHTDEPPCFARKGQASKDRRPSSSTLARLARVEKSLAQLVGAVMGRPTCLDAWVHDVTQRLERMEMLLFSCNFDQFSEIDEMLKALRKESSPDSIAWSSTQDAVDLEGSSSDVSSHAGMLCAPGLSYAGHASTGTRSGQDYEGIGFTEGADIEDKVSWSLEEEQDLGAASSWSMGWPANRWDSDLFDIELCVADSTDEKAKDNEPHKRASQDFASNTFTGVQWPFGSDLGEELSFDELIASNRSGALALPQTAGEAMGMEEGDGERQDVQPNLIH